MGEALDFRLLGPIEVWKAGSNGPGFSTWLNNVFGKTSGL